MSARDLVNRQAEDEALWAPATTAPEAYVQRALRALHAAVEGEAPGGGAAEGRAAVEEGRRRGLMEAGAACAHQYDGSGGETNPINRGVLLCMAAIRSLAASQTPPGGSDR